MTACTLDQKACTCVHTDTLLAVVLQAFDGALRGLAVNDYIELEVRQAFSWHVACGM